MTESTDLMVASERPEIVTDDLAGMTLEQLAERANAEGRLVASAVDVAAQAMSDGLMHALNAGEALLAARNRVGDGDWGRWVDEHLEFSRGLAQKYMRVAHYRPQVERWAANSGEAHGGIVLALRAIQGLPAVNTYGWASPGEDVKEEARRLYAEGVNVTQICKLLGTTWSVTKGWIDPEYRKDVVRRGHRSAMRRREAAKALAEKEEREKRDRLAKQAGGQIATTYSYTRKALAALSAAIEEAEGGEQRDALRSAMAKLHAAEDEIVRALKVERRAA